MDLDRSNIKRSNTVWEYQKKLARFGEGAPRSDCPTVPCTTPETVYDHATPAPRHPYNLHLHLALYYATPAPCR